MSKAAWPTDLVFKTGEQALHISFDDGVMATIPYKLLRENSPSAEVQGHGGEKPPQPPVPEDISVVAADPVGRFAVRIAFSDGHSTGLYTWSLLRTLGETNSAD